MPSLSQLITNLRLAYPDLIIAAGDRFRFHPPRTIFYPKNPPATTAPCLYLLHEVGHYLQKDQNYTTDLELLQLESRAWANAKTLCQKFQITWDQTFAEHCLDSYRDWLHNRSLCPNCLINGYSDPSGLYHCPLCAKTWRHSTKPH